MATAGEMSHLMGLQGTARERFARTLARREEQTQACQGCGKDFPSTRDRERFCGPECCVGSFEAKRRGVKLQPPDPEKRCCDQCGVEFSAKRIDARLCSSKCRMASSRGKPAKELAEAVTDKLRPAIPEIALRGSCAPRVKQEPRFKPLPEEKEPAA